MYVLTFLHRNLLWFHNDASFLNGLKKLIKTYDFEIIRCTCIFNTHNIVRYYVLSFGYKPIIELTI